MTSHTGDASNKDGRETHDDNSVASVFQERKQMSESSLVACCRTADFSETSSFAYGTSSVLCTKSTHCSGRAANCVLE
eukprot:scaffold20497_cov51-Attheya_sp.AAC.2